MAFVQDRERPSFWKLRIVQTLESGRFVADATWLVQTTKMVIRRRLLLREWACCDQFPNHNSFSKMGLVLLDGRVLLLLVWVALFLARSFHLVDQWLPKGRGEEEICATVMVPVVWFSTAVVVATLASAVAARRVIMYTTKSMINTVQ